jgi:hypothetical protein
MSAEEDQDQSGRDQATGRFVPGVSGNKAGRPKGPTALRVKSLKDAVIGAAERVGFEIDPASPDGLEAYLAELARRDKKAFATLLGRVLPLQSIRFPLPEITRASDLVKASSAVAQAVSEGELAPHDASAISAVLGGVAKAIELHEISERLAKLEAAVAKEVPQ